MNAQEKITSLRTERCGLHDQIDSLVVSIREDEADYQKRQGERQAEIDKAAKRISEIKNECAALESVQG